jgi:hypothetical protein
MDHGPPDPRVIAPGAGRRDHPRVIHRSRRQPAALPARRGMRASWFRGRYAADQQRPADAAGATETPPGETGPTDPAPVEPADSRPAAESPARTADPAPVATVRPVHGHPTF